MNEDQRQAFKQAGIPVRYLEGNLGAMGAPAADLLAFVKSHDFEIGIRNGRGHWLWGDDDRCEEALHHLCKSTMVRGIDAIVLTPTALHEALTANDADGVNDLAEAVWTADALFMSCFDDVFYEANPLPAKDRYNIEDFLISRIRGGKSITVHTAARLTSAWWSPRLLRQIASVATVFEI